ncbi:MAG: ribosome biogenesis GTPase Der [Candidatus Lightella neohaematopini]|nr:ribosome biogenesis GTPase Der [Candidatus Lightella neohaematopini]MCV2528991.1 ribosome biogenesis GTPase Der [Candidatus Lightella neohaematopini]
MITLVGRNNVGKSTLFNVLINKKLSLVNNYPGFTSDYIYGYTKINNITITVVDTGGIYSTTNSSSLEYKITQQSIFLLKRTTVILFLVDGTVEITNDDTYIAKIIKSLKKEVIIVVNKIDITSDIITNKFYSLGVSSLLCKVSAINKNINQLLSILELIINKYKNKLTSCLNINSSINKIKVFIFGQPNVGKSTLVNKLLNKHRVLVSNIPGTTRNNITSDIIYNGFNYEITDSVGINKNYLLLKNKKSLVTDISKTIFNTIKYTNVTLHIICLVDKKISHYDLSLVKLIVKKNIPIIIIINKCDIYNDLDEIKFNVTNQLNFVKFIKILFISALYNQNFDSLFKLINKINKMNSLVFKTRYVNNILYDAINNYYPTCRDKLIKLKYAYISNYSPIIINIYGTRTYLLSKSYKRYLTNYFQRTLNILGTSIYIKFINNK